MSRVLVTGGAGFVGSHVVDLLAGTGTDVVVLDDFRTAADPRTAGTGPEGVTYVVGDVTDPDAWAGALRGVDAVCHQAARVGLGLDFADAPAYVADNDLGTAVGLAALHHAGFSGPLVLASSMVVYGEGRYRCRDHGDVRAPPRRPADLDAGLWDPLCPACDRPLAPEPVTEDAPVDPRSVYAATKLQQEHLCAVFGREHEAPVFALRYHNVYGPRMPRDTPYAGVASIFGSALAAGRPPRVFEDGGQRRDFVHVHDVARANVVALAGDAEPGAYNIATGRPRTVLDLAGGLADLAGPDAPRPEVVGGYRLGDVRHVFASPDRARTRLGFVAEVGFEDGLATLEVG